MRSGAFIVLIVACLLSVGCQPSPQREPAIGEAFVGPLNLNLRSDLAVRAQVVATVKHGDRVEIIRTRRRFLLVRAPNGAEGWTDERSLLSTAQMSALRLLAEQAAQMPSQGSATVYSTLNIHTQPNRGSPSFYQMAEGGKVDVLAYRVEPRVPYQQPPLARSVERPPPPRKPKAKSKKESEIGPPPPPPPPGLPPNWLDLSKSAMPEEPEDLDEPPEEPAPPPPEPPKQEPPKPPVPETPLDHWSLVRVPDGRVGWVLVRALVMAIPDEVAQYAEGHRITSYFSLGEVRDGDQTKHNWLWTTLSQGLQGRQFDSFRVFTWSLRRHRYETTYIERRLMGFLPAEARHVQIAVGKQKITVPGFSLLTEDKSGQLWRRTFAYEGYRVRVIAREPAEKPVIPAILSASDGSLPKEQPVRPDSAVERLKRGIGGFFRRR